MNENIRLRLEYKRQMRKGNSKKAMSILQKLWKMNTTKPKSAQKSALKMEVKFEKASSDDDLLDNYLAQNTRTVTKSLREDNLDKGTLEKLYELEDKTKHRRSILRLLRKLLRG